jgi:hypothetical protein
MMTKRQARLVRQLMVAMIDESRKWPPKQSQEEREARVNKCEQWLMEACDGE